MATGTRLRHPKFQSLDECLKNIYPIQVDLEYRLQ